MGNRAAPPPSSAPSRRNWNGSGGAGLKPAPTIVAQRLFGHSGRADLKRVSPGDYRLTLYQRGHAVLGLPVSEVESLIRALDGLWAEYLMRDAQQPELGLPLLSLGEVVARLGAGEEQA